MAKYKCEMCGYIYDEEVEGKPFSELDDNFVCPMCQAPKDLFEKAGESAKVVEKQNETIDTYLKKYERDEDHREALMKDIHTMAKTGQTIGLPMSTKISIASWDEILLLGGQLAHPPLLDEEKVNTTTIIGKNAKKPMELSMPVYVSHMSFGALSREAKTALAKGSAAAKTAMCSGEGGILEDERSNAYKYIFEYVPNRYSVTDDNLKRADALELKIGQGTKPGMGGHLPGAKVTEEIAEIRGKKVGEDIHSPSKFKEIVTSEDLKKLIDELREKSEGRPIGVKIAAGHIEDDLAFIIKANPDFITIDGRGGATASSPKMLREASSVPTIFALYRAKKFLDEHNCDIDLVITGGIRVASDIAKAIAMGASAVAIASSAMMAIGCQQYRVCHNGMCPVGIATQDENLRKRFNVEMSAKRLENFLNVTKSDLEMFGRISGHDDIHDLNTNDIVTVNSEISDNTNIKHV